MKDKQKMLRKRNDDNIYMPQNKKRKRGRKCQKIVKRRSNLISRLIPLIQDLQLCIMIQIMLLIQPIQNL